MIATTFACLVLGHAIGDTLLRDRAVPQPWPVLVRMLAHLLALVPAWCAGATNPMAWQLLVLALGGLHWLCSLGTSALEQRFGQTLPLLLADQAVRFGMLGCAAWLVHDHVRTRDFDGARLVVIAAAYLLVTSTGADVVRRLLARHALPMAAGDPDTATPALRLGRTIGVLERALGLTFILLDAWTGLAGIVAAKSIARFKDLEQRAFAEYFLVGTLASLLVTAAVGAATMGGLAALR